MKPKRTKAQFNRDKKKYIKECLEAIENYKISRISHVIGFIGLSSTPFYDRYELHKVDEIVDAIHKNKLIMKAQMRLKWIRADSASLQIALYKVLADEDELERLKSNPEININTNKRKDIPKRIIYKIKKGKIKKDQ